MKPLVARSRATALTGPRVSNPSGLALRPVLKALSACPATAWSVAQTARALCAAGWVTTQADDYPREKPMVTIQVQGLQPLLRSLNGLSTDLPKAIANGLNRVGETLIERERLEMQQVIVGGPVPFTLNAHGQFKARPRVGTIDTVVFVKDKQAAYLQSPVFGKPYSGLVPGPAARINTYGNIPGKKGGLASIRSKLKADGEFIGRVRGVATHGRYAGERFDIFARWARLPRQKGRTNRLVVVAKSVINNDREINLRWYEVAEDWVERKLPDYVRSELDILLAIYGRN